jgi:hypothetical protein
MNPREECNSPGSARVSVITNFFGDPSPKKRLLRRDAATNTRDAYTTRSKFYRCAGDPI